MPANETAPDRIAQADWDQLQVVCYDLSGIPRGRLIQRRQGASLIESGINMSTAIFSFTSFETMGDQPEFTARDGDFFMRPDPSTLAPLAYQPGTSRVICDLFEPDGTPWPACPRHVLRRVLEKYEERGLYPLAAFEPEGYFTLQADGRWQPADDSACFSLAGLESHAGLLSEITAALEAMDIPVEKLSSEYGPGQYEFNLTPADPLTAADQLVTLKDVIKAVARQHGLEATFMPKPFGDLPGSGLHLHLSLYRDPAHEQPVFAAANGGGLSTQGRHFTGGLLQHSPALTAITAPTANSYKRMLPGHWAPYYAFYAEGNRDALVRVTGQPARLEFRGGDSSASAYLYLAAVLLAGLDGLEQEIDPGDPLNADAHQLEDQEGIPVLPQSAREALNCLEGDEVIAGGLGEQLTRTFLDVKRSEALRFARQVTGLERQTYLKLI